MANEAVVIGLLEDDRDQAELYRAWLEQAGFMVRSYAEVKDFRRRLGAESIDLLLLDWNLGEGSGLDLLEWLRQSAHARLPVIFLTARTAEEDIVSGLKAGADDYVVKPAKASELIARIQTVLRRSGVANTPTGGGGAWVEEVLPYKFDLDKRSVTLNGELIELTDREFDLASYLFRRHGRIVSRAALLENVWNLGGDVNTRTVDTHVSRLRKKMMLTGESGWVLSAVYQHGYRLEPAK